MPLHFTQVDAFTDTPFTGNPAAVCVLPEAREAGWMQQVAREMNLSETAFLVPEAEGYHLRWFTPTTEVDLCGHATLAAAHVLWEDGHLPPDAVVVFRTRSGRLTAQRDGAWIEMDFPAERPEEADAPEELAAALGAAPQWVGRNRMDLFALLENEEAVRRLQPDLVRLVRIEARGVIVTARADAGPYDFVSRFFGPRVGVPEDPVTGSAHCGLGPFWQQRLGRDVLAGYQASDRGGLVRVRVRASGRVGLAGQAVTVLRGEIL